MNAQAATKESPDVWRRRQRPHYHLPDGLRNAQAITAEVLEAQMKVNFTPRREESGDLNEADLIRHTLWQMGDDPAEILAQQLEDAQSLLPKRFRRRGKRVQPRVERGNKAGGQFRRDPRKAARWDSVRTVLADNFEGRHAGLPHDSDS